MDGWTDRQMDREIMYKKSKKETIEASTCIQDKTTISYPITVLYISIQKKIRNDTLILFAIIN